MLAILLGAGFSKWCAGLPLATGLFDFRIEPFGSREIKALERVQHIKSEWDCAHPQAHTEEFISDVLSSGHKENRKLVLWYIVRRLSEPYVWKEWHAGRWRRHVLMIDEHRKVDRPGVARARDFMTQLGFELAGIVTPNYDLLVEYALGTKGFHYGHPGEVLTGRGPYPVSQWKNPVTLTGRIPIAKLHGSISWDENGRYTDGRRGLTGNALIVAPTPEKCASPELATEWALSERILQGAPRILVFGFGFNPYDEALLAHLRKSGTEIRKVAIVDICSRSREAENLWPQARIRCFPPPPEEYEELRSWLRNVKT